MRGGGRVGGEVVEGLWVGLGGKGGKGEGEKGGKGERGEVRVRVGELAQVVKRGGRGLVVLVGEAEVRILLLLFFFLGRGGGEKLGGGGVSGFWVGGEGDGRMGGPIRWRSVVGGGGCRYSFCGGISTDECS